MRITIEVVEEIKEEEVVIRCRELSEEVQKIQSLLKNIKEERPRISYYKGEKEFYISLEEILFFETDANGICAHTKDEIYEVKYKLYELEEVLPGHFMRISKSTILNIKQIYSITRNLTGASLVEFLDTHKTVYVSRYYYKLLKEKLEEKRN